MVYTVSSYLAVIASYVTDWVLCPEAILLFVISLSLFNILRLFRGIFICFCRWKYKDDKLTVESKGLCEEEKDGFKKYCHEAKSCDMATFSLQGRRKTMEDRFSSIPHNFEENHSVYAVFDGHGGEFAAEYIEDQLFRSIRKEFTRGSFQAGTESVKKVLTSLIRTIDAQLICLSRDRMDLSGSTCILAFHQRDMLTVANVGDSRAVMCTGDGRAVAMSLDHKPSDPKEQKRITEAGGFVTFNGVWRVAGVLATSRAFGDYPLKQRKFVTVEPDFYTVDLSKIVPHFIILASDGLWDVFSNKEAVNFIRGRLDEPHLGAKSLALQAYYRGSLDNITVMVINLKKKRNSQKKYERALHDSHKDNKTSDNSNNDNQQSHENKKDNKKSHDIHKEKAMSHDSNNDRKTTNESLGENRNKPLKENVDDCDKEVAEKLEGDVMETQVSSGDESVQSNVGCDVEEMGDADSLKDKS